MRIESEQFNPHLDNSAPWRARTSKLELAVILLLSVGGIQGIIFPGPTVSVAIQFCIFIIIAALFAINFRFLSQLKFEYKNICILFFVYGVFVSIHSLFVANSYEQWRYLATVFAPTLLLPGFCTLGTNPQSISLVFKSLLRFTIPISIIFNVEGATDDRNHNLVYINYVSFIYLFIILLPFLKYRWKIVLVLLSLLSFFYDIDSRSNMLGIIVSYGIVVIYYLSLKLDATYAILQRLLVSIRHLFLFLPIVLLILGAFHIFNIFNFIDTKGEHANLVISSESGRILTTDSRTGIYIDAFENLSEKNDWLFGSSATVMYKTLMAETDVEYESGRLGASESGFIGLLTFGGITYVAIFFLLCYFSTYLAIYKSNNLVVKLIGIFVAFRWFYSFIENTLVLDFTLITLFLAMGIAFSAQFRSMSNKEISDYFRAI